MAVTSLSGILLLLAGAVFLTYVIRVLLRAFNTPLRDVPGPWLARYTSLWKLWEVHGGTFEKTNVELHRKYGPVVRLGPNEYSIDDPDAAKIIYGHGRPFMKSAWYYASGNVDQVHKFDLFSDQNAKRHSESRRKIASAYSMTSLLKMEGFVDNCSKILVEKFSGFAAKGEVINLGRWLQCYAFDVRHYRSS